VRIVEDPGHGEVTLKEDTGFTGLARDNSRFECNKQKSERTALVHRGEDGFAGRDSATAGMVQAGGRESGTHFAILRQGQVRHQWKCAPFYFTRKRLGFHRDG
jgi:hypothetical protein